MTDLLIIKTAALGDVLRTTAILPGLHARHPGARVTWVTSEAAVDLVRTNPLVAEVVAVDVQRTASVDSARARLAERRWMHVVSLDDEPPLCALASSLTSSALTGAHLAADGSRAYTRDAAEWFDMGLLSVHGKQRADELKLRNQRSQPRIYADMLGIEMGKPALQLTPDAESFAAAFARRHELTRRSCVIGLNTGAGGRWTSKQLSVERTVELVQGLARALGPKAAFVIFGGESEVARNQEILAQLARAGLGLQTIDAGCRNPLLPFAALVGKCALLVTSDSLALHMALARDVRLVAFFAPTSAAEIELYGLGEKVVSTAPDYCSYKADTDNSTITSERLTAACLRVLGARAAS